MDNSIIELLEDLKCVLEKHDFCISLVQGSGGVGMTLSSSGSNLSDFGIVEYIDEDGINDYLKGA